jgi:hypothetical protein
MKLKLQICVKNYVGYFIISGEILCKEERKQNSDNMNCPILIQIFVLKKVHYYFEVTF